MNFSSQVPHPFPVLASLVGLCALLFITFSVPATVPSKAKSREPKEGK